MFMLHNFQVFIPKAAAQAARRVLAPRSFDESGSEILADFIDETVIKMKSEQRDALLQQLGACAVAVRTLGTMCSGTECPVLVQRAVRLAALRHSVHFQFEHVFSCDKSETAQRFIKTVIAGHVKKLFRDTAEVASPSKRAPDLMTDGEESFVDTVLELIAGFPCTDVSSLRVGAKENREVIKDGAARTGGVFADILQYLSIHQKVESLLLENVKGLGAKKAGQQYSNLDWCVALLESLGYWVFVMLLDPRALGMPVSRNRYWIICIKLSVFTDAGISSEQATALAKELMQDVVSGQPWRNLEDYLLPENHRRSGQSSSGVRRRPRPGPSCQLGLRSMPPIWRVRRRMARKLRSSSSSLPQAEIGTTLSIPQRASWRPSRIWPGSAISTSRSWRRVASTSSPTRACRTGATGPSSSARHSVGLGLPIPGSVPWSCQAARSTWRHSDVAASDTRLFFSKGFTSVTAMP